MVLLDRIVSQVSIKFWHVFLMLEITRVWREYNVASNFLVKKIVIANLPQDSRSMGLGIEPAFRKYADGCAYWWKIMSSLAQFIIILAVKSRNTRLICLFNFSFRRV